jgi:hypothetical protein
MEPHNHKLSSTNPTELTQQLLYLIEWKNNIIGAFNNLSDAETYIYGCFQNNFMTSAKIKIYTFTIINKNWFILNTVCGT